MTEDQTGAAHTGSVPKWLRIVLVVAAVVLPVLGLLLVTVVIPSSPDRGVNDTADSGHSALAALLRDEGIAVDEQTRFVGVEARVDEHTTVVVSNPSTLNRRTWQALLALRPAQIVLVDPSGFLVERIGLAVTPLDSVDPGVADPQCSDPLATRAGAISIPGGAEGFEAAGATGCYPGGGGHLMLQVDVDGVAVTILPRISSNEFVAVQGNASLAMQVLGQHPQTLWYHPSSSDDTVPGSTGGNDPRPRPTLLPPGWPYAVALTCVAVIVIALWRGRRLGPVLTEELPSVVPASETVEGHGRLYERLRARDTAATHLRRAAISRLSRMMGRADDTEVLAQALAERTGRPYEQIRHALAGPTPPTDEELVTLKHALDALEQEARRP